MKKRILGVILLAIMGFTTISSATAAPWRHHHRDHHHRDHHHHM